MRNVDESWWRINPSKRATYDIEWNSKTGKVRGRLNSPTRKTQWEYADVYDIRHAESAGYQIITRHERGKH